MDIASEVVGQIQVVVTKNGQVSLHSDMPPAQVVSILLIAQQLAAGQAVPQIVQERSGISPVHGIIRP
jgi:hypothetical protein